MSKLKTLKNVPDKVDGKTIQDKDGILSLKSDTFQLNEKNIKLGQPVILGDGLSAPISNDQLENTTLTINDTTASLGGSILHDADFATATCWTSDARNSQLASASTDYMFWSNWTEVSDPFNIISIATLNNGSGTTPNNQIKINNTGLYVIEISWSNAEPASSAFNSLISLTRTAVNEGQGDAGSSSGSDNFITYNGITLSFFNTFDSFSNSRPAGRQLGDSIQSFRRLKLYVDVTDVTGNKHIGENGNTFSLTQSPLSNTQTSTTMPWTSIGMVTVQRLGDT